MSATPGIARQCAWYRWNNAAHSQSHVNNTFAYKNVKCASTRSHILWTTEQHWFCVWLQFPLVCKQKGGWTAGACTGGTECLSMVGSIALSNLTLDWSRKREETFTARPWPGAAAFPHKEPRLRKERLDVETVQGCRTWERGEFHSSCSSHLCQHEELPSLLWFLRSNYFLISPELIFLLSKFSLSLCLDFLFSSVGTGYSVPAVDTGFQTKHFLWNRNESFLKLQCTFSIFKLDKSSSP